MEPSFTYSLILYFCFAILWNAPCQALQTRTSSVNWANIVTPRGDKFPDFSYCGYRNSETPIPSITTPQITIESPGNPNKDMAPEIQRAIDSLFESGGGVVKVPSGRFAITAGIQIRSKVIVTGSGTSDTTLVMKRKPTKPVFTLGRLGVAPSADFGYRSKITNSYVPTGSSTVTVRNSAGFSVGQDVYISRAVTDGWLRYNGMDDLVRDGDEQTWIPIGQKIMSPNTIKAVNGNQITFRIPLADSLNSKYMAPEVWAYTAPDRTSEMGVQNLRIEVPNTCSGTSLLNTTCNYAAVRFSSWTVDSWAKGLTLVGFNKFFEVQKNAARITIQSNTMDRDRDIEGTILPFDIALKGSQVLVKDCEQVGLSTARSFSLSTDALTPGPNAVVRYSTPSNLQIIAPYQRWAWGLLVEDTSVATRFENRGNKGSGHGWTMNSGVGWNLRGKTVFESPPLGTNWCVGCGRPESETGSGNGTFILKGTEVTPTSLFGSQLSARGF